MISPLRLAWTAAAWLLMVSLPGGGRAAEIPTVGYAWRNVAIGGGGFVTGIVFHPASKGLMYARTDVGGAYRWDGENGRWIPLTDWIGEADWNLLGIESVAVDPRDPARVYLAAGTYTRFPGAILRSDDQGRTFKRTNVPFAMGGNEPGRFAGERLAVDPNDGAVLFFGSRRDGLWRSADHAATWQHVAGFPNIEEPADPAAEAVGPRRAGRSAVGIVSVVFDSRSGGPGRPTPIVYAAGSTNGAALYRSTDAGRTWKAVDRQPTGLRPNHLVLASDGRLYLTYGREPGPAQITAGAVWAFDPANEVWTDISPIKGSAIDQPFGYGCIAVDSQHPRTLLVTTFAHWKPHDQIFRSTDGGVSWRALWDDESRWDHRSAPYTASRSPHWMGTVVINPFNSDETLFTTGYGIWASRDVTAADAGRPVHWTFLDEGLEETVPLALISPPAGAHLISGLGDIDGFRHDDLNGSPVAGTFSGPRFSSTRDLAFAATRPTTLARIGNAGRGVAVHVAMSDDGGETWAALASDAPGGDNGLGRIALGADAKALVWLLSDGAVFETDDRGRTWQRSTGATMSPASSLAADPVEATRFYAFDPQSGRLFVSTDSARHFSLKSTPIGAASATARGDMLTVAPERAGDVWIGTRAAGLFHSTDAGATFTKMEGVEAAEALGFGKPAEGNAYPALYLRGRIDGQQGFYRSDDGGRNWVRINDDRHQYGAANRPLIVGDPRIYGRVYLTTGGRGIIYGDCVP